MKVYTISYLDVFLGSASGPSLLHLMELEEFERLGWMLCIEIGKVLG